MAAHPDFIGGGLYVAATAHDGTVETLEGRGVKFILAVQWHRECINNPKHTKIIFDEFINNC